jgi:hypothetical protein
MVRRFFGLAVGLQVVDNGQTSTVLEGQNSPSNPAASHQWRPES